MEYNNLLSATYKAHSQAQEHLAERLKGRKRGLTRAQLAEIAAMYTADLPIMATTAVLVKLKPMNKIAK